MAAAGLLGPELVCEVGSGIFSESGWDPESQSLPRAFSLVGNFVVSNIVIQPCIEL